MPTDPETGARYRLNAKQSVKDVWTLDCTIEYKQDEIVKSADRNDMAVVKRTALGAKILAIIKETETVFRLDGRVMAGDEHV